MRSDPIELAREDLIEIAQKFGLELAFDSIGLGGAASLVETLMTLADLVASDKTPRTAVEHETRHLLIEDAIAALTLQL